MSSTAGGGRRGELLGHREAVKIGQLNVEQDDPRPQRDDRRHGFCPVVASQMTSKPSAWSNARAEARKAAWSSTISTVGRMPLIVPQATRADTVASTNIRIGTYRGARSASLAPAPCLVLPGENCGQPQP